MKVKVTSHATGHVYTVEKLPNGDYRCNCVEFSVRTNLQGRKGFKCRHIEKVMKKSA